MLTAPSRIGSLPRPRRSGPGWTVLALVLLGALPVGRAADGDRAAIGTDWARIVEADWARQEILREAPAASPAGRVAPDQDAAGGCDGVKDGQWGFHTEDEPQPWWQVDLGSVRPLDRVVLYNRCDACGQRNHRILVLLSDDGQSFRQAYQHDGTAFLGFPDKKPLTVPLGGAPARFLRLQLPGKSYFHLDEVEVHTTGSPENIALRRPAAQSSVSQWSRDHAVPSARPPRYPTEKVIGRGLRLAASLGRFGVDVEAAEASLRALGEQFGKLAAEAPAQARRALHLEARWAVRSLALRNPLLDFDRVLFVQAAPGRFPHMSDQFYGWWSRPGGAVCILEGIHGPAPRVRRLTEGLPEGSFLKGDLSWDGKTALFAWCRFHPEVPDLKDKAHKPNLPEDAFFHIFEVGVDGSGLRQLSRGRYDDFDPRYLPDGRIVFLSTRKGCFLQCTRANSAATAAADLPDSYVRCGGDEYRPVPVFTLHTMDDQGGTIRPLSAFENFEWSPEVAADGQVLYTRWDYIDRFNGHFFSLWSTHPDGTMPQLVYGNYTMRPQVVVEARPIPGSGKLIFTAAAHHSITGGSLVLLDRSRGTEGDAPLTRLTPEVPFPETEAWPEHYYANPWPLSEEFFLVAWSDRKLPPHCRVDSSVENPPNAAGIYLLDAFGNLELLHRDPGISSTAPIPLRPRSRPPAMPDSLAWEGPQEGRLLIQDVYRGLTGVPRGTVKGIRVVAVPPKVQPRMNSPLLGISAEDPGKYLLGTAPVEEDGSAHFRVPSGIPVFFQAVDAAGQAVQTMRSLTYVWPGQTLACVGCHESREAAPAGGARSIAAAREPSKLRPGPEGSWPLRFDRLVQPVLDRACASCHRPGGEGGADRLDLTAAKSYDALLQWGSKDLHGLAFEKDRSLPGDCVARRSRLLPRLREGKEHEAVRLEAGDLERLAVWMDLYAQKLGHFSDVQEAELADLRKAMAPLLER